jgi:hypothetical protein
MRTFVRSQLRDYHSREGVERDRWVLAWLGVIALILLSAGVFLCAILTGDISKESVPSNG